MKTIALVVFFFVNFAIADEHVSYENVPTWNYYRTNQIYKDGGFKIDPSFNEAEVMSDCQKQLDILTAKFNPLLILKRVNCRVEKSGDFTTVKAMVNFIL